MQIREIDGQEATNRPGAAEYLNRSLQTINLVASPKQRAVTGWPSSLATIDGQEWYALGDLDRFRLDYLHRVEQANLARVHSVTLDGDPDELLSAKTFRDLIGATAGTWSRYVHDSKPAWLLGQDGYLPRPDAEEPARRGITRYWRRARVETWINSRGGKVPSPGRPAQERREALDGTDG